ncbi:MAG: hypothetical protein QM811_09900 [Pirellulales bacterium]
MSQFLGGRYLRRSIRATFACAATLRFRLHVDGIRATTARDQSSGRKSGGYEKGRR